jgi:hypothetical protein
VRDPPWVSTSFALRNSDLLPILHVGKASVKRTVWKASARTVPDPFPSIQENLRPFSLTSPLNFMQFHAPLDKVQSCFAVKETAFQFGCSNFPAARTRSYTSMAPSQAISIARNHSKLASRARRLPVSCLKPCSPLPNCGATLHTICTFTSLPTLTASPLSFFPPPWYDASYMHKHSHPYCQRCRNHLPCCSSWDTPYGHATSWK